MSLTNTDSLDLKSVQIRTFFNKDQVYVTYIHPTKRSRRFTVTLEKGERQSLPRKEHERVPTTCNLAPKRT